MEVVLTSHSGNPVEYPCGDKTDDGENQEEKEPGVMICFCHALRLRRDSGTLTTSESFSVGEL